MYESNSFAEGYAIGRDNNNSGFGGGEGWWIIIILAMLWGGFGNNGFGRGGYGGAGSEMLGYELGKVATTNDVASGFNNSAVLSSLNDIKLGQAQMQNYVNQGFVGVDRATTQGFYNLSSQLASCCCDTRAAIADLKYANEKQTCDILGAINGSTQRVIDYMQNEKINALQAENIALKGRISNANQTADIVAALRPVPVPAYAVPNPNCCYYGNNTNTVL